MQIPTITGLIRRRILVNYRVDPEVASRILPRPFRPRLFQEHALAGICLIRLEQVRPQRLPAFVGLASENAAHRVAVEWDDAQGETRQGVFVTRRDSGSWLNHLAGDRFFPGVHHRAKFETHDSGRSVIISMQAHDGQSSLEVAGTATRDWPATSIFESLNQASEYFQAGALGYSLSDRTNRLDGLELDIPRWSVEPFQVESLRSSYFDDTKRFPRGLIELDHALLMRNAAHTWHSVACLPCGA